jgi:hypothetical protein
LLSTQNCWIDAVRSGSHAFGALQRILKARQVGEATLVDGVYQSVTDPRRLVVLRRTELRAVRPTSRKPAAQG